MHYPRPHHVNSHQIIMPWSRRRRTSLKRRPYLVLVLASSMLVSKSGAFQHHGVLRTSGVTTLPSESSSRVITPKAPSALLSCAQQDVQTKKRPFYSRLEVFNALSTGNVHQAFVKISILLLGSSFADPFLLSPLPAMAADPSRAQIQQVQRAFQAFNDRDLRNAEALFDQSVQAWEQLERPRDEMAALVKARGNVKVDLKKFEAAIEDFDRVLSIMSVDGTKTDGSGEAAYSEYPDVFVQRGLAWEGLSKWEAAVQDYSRAIQLWGGGRGEGINPFVLTFRGNALTRLGRYKDALQDFEASADLFLASRDEEDALLARANAALTYYELGYEETGVKLMQDVLRRQPGFVDVHVALAAHAWGEGNLGRAEKEWRFACEQTTTGCASYRDLDFVQRIRRWPPSLVKKLEGFLAKSKVVAGGGSSVLR
ncbi:tpr-repeat protein [Nannochloropsis gaditana]|uniref:Tpr-repeat protein n=2 Tax=Nannochloropsis gaditana TaxID=72520 RepID=W7UAX4_9STRA|nr:tpr-repeat protein [Nannochloropsis gaditana]